MPSELTSRLDLKLEPATAQQLADHLLRLFRKTAETVPAYRAMLAGYAVDPTVIRTLDDFRTLPLLDKQNYNNRFPLADLCRDGKIESCDMIAVSSGSTGTPTFWLRSTADEDAVAVRFEQIFHDSFRADTRRTLAVVCFPLGTWVGGMYTAACCRRVAAVGYPVTVVTPGNNKAEIMRVVQALGDQFDQTVLLGYPPFLKDTIDTGRSTGIDWSLYNIKLVLAGEVFSEEWRELVCERAGASDPMTATASLYGTADAGVLGNETPLSIALRRFFARHPAAAREIFGESRLPTLVQYDPLSRYFETTGVSASPQLLSGATDGTLLFTGDSGIPLIRYHIQDTGGLVSYYEMLRFAASRGFEMPSTLQDADTRGVREMPFVYVFGRSHFAVSFYGANVYPENVAVGLEQPGIKDLVTGKFVMQVVESADRDSRLSVVVELAANIAPADAMADRIAASVRDQIARLNSEFANYVPIDRQAPDVDLRPAGDPEYFPIGIKHRYTRKRDV